ncbi:MAG: sulfur carrier protein ThiS [Thermoanaerobaculia bacterium]
MSTLLLNGEARPLTPGATVLDLVTELGRHPRAVAVELNGRILPREAWGDRELQAGDRVEIVHFVQGGSGRRGNSADRADVEARMECVYTPASRGR